MNILAISGSLRTASFSTALVQAAVKLSPEGVRVEIYDGIKNLPHFSPDIDGSTPPEAVAEFRARIQAAGGVLICTPEYAYGMPGALKNALDWLVSSGDLYKKPVMAVSASPSAEGGSRGLAWLRQTLSALDAVVPEEASFTIPFIKQKLGGDRVSDAKTAERLRQALTIIERLGKAT